MLDPSVSAVYCYTTTALGAIVNAHLLEYAIRERPTLRWAPALLVSGQCMITVICLRDIFRYQSLPPWMHMLMALYNVVEIAHIVTPMNLRTASPSKIHRFEARMRGRINWIWGTTTRVVEQIRNRLFPSPVLCQINPEPNQRLEDVPEISDSEAMMILRHALPHMGASAALMQSSQGVCQLVEGCMGKERRETPAIRDFCEKILSSLKDTTVLSDLDALHGNEVPFVQRLVRFARPEQLVRVAHTRLRFQIETEALIQEKIREGVTENTTIDTLNTCPPEWRPAIARQVLGSVEELKDSRQVADFLIDTEDLSAEILVKHFSDQPEFIWRQLENLPLDDFTNAFQLFQALVRYNSETAQGNSVKERLKQKIAGLPDTADKHSVAFCLAMLLASHSDPALLSNEQIATLKNYLTTYDFADDPGFFNTICIALKFHELEIATEQFVPPVLEITPITEENQNNSPLVTYNLLKNPEIIWLQLSNFSKMARIRDLLKDSALLAGEETISSIVNHVIENEGIEDHGLLIRELLPKRNYWRLVKQLIDGHLKDSTMRNGCIDEIRKCIHSHIEPNQLPFLLLDAVQNLLPQDEARKVYKSLAFGVKRTSIVEEMLKTKLFMLYGTHANQSRLDAETQEVFLSPPMHQLWQLATSLCALES